MEVTQQGSRILSSKFMYVHIFRTCQATFTIDLILLIGVTIMVNLATRYCIRKRERVTARERESHRESHRVRERESHRERVTE